MKLLLLVGDGMGDVGENTPLQTADKPNMDKLAASGRCGLLDIGYRKTVNSDYGYLHLLGCFSRDKYPGRGYLEALGIGLEPNAEDVCIRCNFATLNVDGMLVDRRAGRDETGLNKFCEKLNGMEIDGVKFNVRKSAGHRVVIVLEGAGLSEKIIPNDPMETGVALPEVGAATPDAKKTASVLNKFVRKSHQILSKEKVNRARKFPANTILIRSPGRRRDVDTLEARHHFKACCIAGVPIAKGVARFLGMDVVPVKGATGMPKTNLEGKAEAAIEALKAYDLVFLHINGTDILSHDARREEKAEFIGSIDKELGKIIKAAGLDGMVVIVTCDHRTASDPSYKAYRHTTDPVPVLISGNNISAGSVKKYDEKSCEAGFRISGNELIEYAKKLARV